MDPLHEALQLRNAGRLPEAKQQLKRLIKQFPKASKAWFLLSQIARAEAAWPEAIAHLQKAMALSPHELTYVEHMAMTRMLSNIGREMLPAIEGFATILAMAAPGAARDAVAVNIQTLCLRCDDPQRIVHTLQPYFEQNAPHGPERLRLAAGIAMAQFILGGEKAAATYARMVIELRAFAYDANGQPRPGDYPFYCIYAQFILDLIAYREHHPARYERAANGVIHALGESHCLTPAGLVVAQRRVQPHLLMGGKAFFFCSDQGETWRYQLARVFATLPKSDPVVVMFGEIDCRPTEGIMEQWRRDPHYAMETEVAKLVDSYVKFIKITQLKRAAPTVIYGVPAPNASVREKVVGVDDQFLAVIRHFNACLAEQAHRQGLPFADIYAATVGEGGWAKAGMHLDEVHLTPGIVAETLAAVL